MEKRYFMSVGVGRVHSLAYAKGTCKNRIHKENYREFSTLEEIRELNTYNQSYTIYVE